MEEITCICALNQALFSRLLSIEDPRVKGRCTYSLSSILFIVTCSLIAGCNTWASMEWFAKKRRRWLKRYIDLSRGIPSALTLARVMSRVSPTEFSNCLLQWTKSTTQVLTRDIIAVDGKSSRGSSRKRGNKKGIHMVNAFIGRTKSTLASLKVKEKSNEIKAIPELLKLINPNGCVITTDAMGTQKGIAKIIREKQGHYVLALKGNHPRFNRKVRHLFLQANKLGYQSMVYRQNESHGYGHGRIEEREYTMLPSMYLMKYKRRWKDLSAVIRVRSFRHLPNGQVETEERFYITSLPFREHQKMCQAIREHWQVENGLHYKLDVGLQEDASQITRGFAAENLSVMRKIVLKLLEREKSCSLGIALKRMQAALSTQYLKKVLTF